MESIEKKSNKIRIMTLVLIVGIIIGSLSGYFFGYYLFISENENTQNQLTTLAEQVDEIIIDAGNNNEIINNIIDSLEEQLTQLNSQISDLNNKADNSDQELSNILSEIAILEAQVISINAQISELENALWRTIQDISSIPGVGVSLSSLFEQVRESVVVIQGLIGFTRIQGSGFVYNHNGNMVILTNDHVIEDTVSITVTFPNGETYDGTIIGSNPNNDFAILSTDAPQETYKSLEIISSSTLKVGHSVIVVGTPFGLEGSLSNGIVSSLSRTISIDGITLNDIIQTTTPLNPGNSGGPLMNLNGEVVGIATAIVEESQGIGFAIPSDAFMTDIQNILGP